MRTALALAVLLLGTLPLQAADRDRLVGIWLFEKEVDLRADGSSAPAGASAPAYDGILTYTADGYVSAVIMPKGRTWDADKATIEEFRDTVSNGTAYAGRYELDESKHTVTHIPRVSLEPYYEGKRLVRNYALDGDTLKVSGTFEYQGEAIRFEIRWRRAGVR